MDKLRDVLTRHNIRADKRFGQNFLSDTNLLEAIVKDAGVTNSSLVLEVGPGTGALTLPLVKEAGRVVAIEIDTRLKPALDELVREHSSLEVIYNDLLKMNPSELNEIMGAPFMVVANLPYYITSPLIFYFLENDFPIESLTIMVQKEVAERITARENTESYGALTAAVSIYARAQIMRIVPRQMFFPQPDVDSAIVKLTMHNEYKERKGAIRLIKCAFSMRRKTLVNNIMKDYGYSRERIESILLEQNIPIKTRGEALSPAALYALSQRLAEEKGEK